MILLIVIILVAAAAAVTGTLGGVLEVAAGVAVGIVLAVIGLALLGYYYARHKLRRMGRDLEHYRQGGYGRTPPRDPGKPRGELPRDADPYG